jgi:hypothetical protein
MRRMRLNSTDASLCFLLFTCLASTAACADGPLGIYLGAGGGASDVRADRAVLGDTNYDSKFDERHSAWKVIAGLRPLSPLGVELEYIDFGNPGSGLNFPGLGGLSKVDERAVALFGVGYLPLTVPLWDVYGKLGIARLRTALTELGPEPLCPVGLTPCVRPTLNQTGWSTSIAFGAGVQRKIGHLAIRAEYERIGVSGSDPDIFSLSLTWAL